MYNRNLLEQLDEFYKTPGHPIFRGGQNQIYLYFGGKLPLKEIKKYLSKDYAYTIHRNQARRKPANPTYKHFKRYQFQLDLMEIGKIAEFNKNHNFILNCIDIYTVGIVCNKKE